jgi:replicative superfamily II helicase
MIALFALGASSALAQAADKRLAPADEYFGPLKLSILGIANSLKDETARVDAETAGDPDSAFQHVTLVEASVRDWETKYPSDTWLPRTVLALERLYAKIESDRSRQHASEIASWLIDRYPASPETIRLRAELTSSSSYSYAR